MPKDKLPDWLWGLDNVPGSPSIKPPGGGVVERKNRTKAEIEELRQFIVANHGHLTSSDLAEELSISASYINLLCKEMCLKPITVEEQTKAYIMDLYQKIPQAVIAKRLELKDSTIKQYYHELGIREPKEVGSPRFPVPTAREILADYRISGDHHRRPDLPDGVNGENVRSASF